MIGINLGQGMEAASQGIEGPSLMMRPRADKLLQLMISRGGEAIHFWLHPGLHVALNSLKEAGYNV
jgi:hypothetical protein